MKRFLPFILISSVVLQFFAPFAIGVGSGIINKNIALGEPLEDKNKSMERVTWDIDGYINAFSGSFLSSNGSMYYKEENSSELSLAVTMDTGVPEGESAFGNWWHVKRGSEGVVGWLDRGLGPLSDGLYFKNFKEEKNLILFIEEVDTKKTGYLDITKNVLQGYLEQGRNLAPEVDATPVKITKVINIKKNITPIGSDGVSFLSPGKNYKISFYYLSGIENLPQEFPDLYEKYRPGTAEKLAGLEKNGPYYIKIASGIFPVASETNQIISPNLEDLREGGTTKGVVGETMLPSCGFSNWTVGGCVARLFYYILFKPSSFLFGLAGTAMDFTIKYSVSDTSYRTPFVAEGWKVVRDLCNMFFIFILLYIALTTILDSGGSKNKSSVINVIIIGLLINFSLFATHLIIDASNIMARVFYNPKVMVVGEKDASGKINSETSADLGHIRLSEGIVSKINPQKLLLTDNQSAIKNTSDNINLSSGVKDDEEDGISGATFTLVIIMSSIVNIVGMITFLTISLSFIGRVVGLWIAMVLSPLAFLSYTIPETKNWGYIGWSSWWSETIKAAFMAPVFVFFMYIIVMFLESGMGLSLLTKSSSLTDLNKVLSVIIPFIVIIVLLKQAEKISTKLAGQVAGTFTKGVGAIGGVALGGAALGVGALGKNTIGRTMAKASRGETSTQKFEAAKNAAAVGDTSLMNSLTKWEKIKGRTGSYATGGFLTGGKKSLLGSAYGKVDISVDPTTGQRKMQVVDGKGIGGIVNKKQEKVNEINKARSKWDETKKDAGVEGLNDKNLSAPDIKKMKKKFKDKNKSEYENEAKNGEISLRDASGLEITSINPATPGLKIKGERTFKADREDKVKNDYIAEQAAAGNVISVNNLSKTDKQKIKEKLDMEFRAVLKTTVDYRSNEKFKETREKAKQNISMTDRGISGANKASFNPANLVNLKSDKRDSFFSKVPKALIVAIATGVRLGLKTVSPSLKTKAESKPQTSAIKEMGEIISGAIKGLGDITSGKK